MSSKLNVTSISEPNATHRALLEAGFIFDGMSARYMFHFEGENVGHTIYLKRADAATFEKAACSVGKHFFQRDLPKEYCRMAYKLSQELIEAHADWEVETGQIVLEQIAE